MKSKTDSARKKVALILVAVLIAGMIPGSLLAQGYNGQDYGYETSYELYYDDTNEITLPPESEECNDVGCEEGGSHEKDEGCEYLYQDPHGNDFTDEEYCYLSYRAEAEEEGNEHYACEYYAHEPAAQNQANQGPNLLANGDFSRLVTESGNGWAWAGFAGGVVGPAALITEGPDAGSQRLSIVNVGTQEWQIQLSQDIVLQAGVEYELRIVARSSQPRPVVVEILNRAPWWLRPTINLTEEWQTFTPAIQVLDTTENGTVRFLFGGRTGFTGEQPHDIYIREVSLVAVGGDIGPGPEPWEGIFGEVRTIRTPVAGHFNTSLYRFPFRNNRTGNAGNNGFEQTLIWYPHVEHTFLPDTEYTVTIVLEPGARWGNNFGATFARSFEAHNITHINFEGLPTEGVRNISSEFGANGSLRIIIEYYATGSEVQDAELILYDNFTGGPGIGNISTYFSRAPEWWRQDMSAWRNDMSNVEERGDDSLLVLSFERDTALGELSPRATTQHRVDNFIRAGGVRTQSATGGNIHFENAFGYYEARIKFPAVNNMWGAFWLMTPNWVVDPADSQANARRGTEIDIIESFHYPFDSEVYGALHFRRTSDTNYSWNGAQNQTDLGFNVFDGEFHIFSLEWNPNEYIYFVNGIEFARYNRYSEHRVIQTGETGITGVGDITQNPNYLKLSVEAACWAGIGSWSPDTPGLAVFDPIMQEWVSTHGGEMLVDYVRVWNGPRPSLTADELADYTAFDIALAKGIAALNELSQADFTADSWLALVAAVEAGNALPRNLRNTLQSKVDATAAAITNAIDGLVPVDTVSLHRITFMRNGGTLNGVARDIAVHNVPSRVPFYEVPVEIPVAERDGFVLLHWRVDFVGENRAHLFLTTAELENFAIPYGHLHAPPNNSNLIIRAIWQVAPIEPPVCDDCEAYPCECPELCGDCKAYPCECPELCEYCNAYVCLPFSIRLYERPNGAEMHRLRFNNPNPAHNNLIPAAHFSVEAKLMNADCALNLLTIVGGANNTIQRIDVQFGDWQQITVTVSRGCAEDTVVLTNPLWDPPIDPDFSHLRFGVRPIVTPVAGHFPTSLYRWAMRPGGTDPAIVEHSFGYYLTLNWYPLITRYFLPDTVYTVTIIMEPATAVWVPDWHDRFPSPNMWEEVFGPDVPASFSEIGATLEQVYGLPAEGVTDVNAWFEGDNLHVSVTFEQTGPELEDARLLLFDDFSGETNQFGLTTYFDRAPNNLFRQDMAIWTDDKAFIRDNQMVLAYSLAPREMVEEHRPDWIWFPNEAARERATQNTIKAGAVRTLTANWLEATFEHAFGYYEARIRFPIEYADNKRGTWGAFWLMNRNLTFEAARPGSTGRAGAEIDIFESINNHQNQRFNAAVHWGGYVEGGSVQSISTAVTSVSPGPLEGNWVNIYDGNYHTFSVEWSPTDYVFFINGMEFASLSRMRTLGGGVGNRARAHEVTENPSYIKLSVESALWALNAVGANFNFPSDLYGEMIIDYIAVWNGPRPNVNLLPEPTHEFRVRSIDSPVAGHFPASLYRWALTQGNARAIGGTPLPYHNYGYDHTLVWYPAIERYFLPDTVYTLEWILEPNPEWHGVYWTPLELGIAIDPDDMRWWQNIPANMPASFAANNITHEDIVGLPTERVTNITSEHRGNNLHIFITFEATGAEIQVPRVLFHDDFSNPVDIDPNRPGMITAHREYSDGVPAAGFARATPYLWRQDLSYWDPEMAWIDEDRDLLVLGVERYPDGFDLHAPAWLSPRPTWLTPVQYERTRRNTLRAGGVRTMSQDWESVYWENAFGFYEARISFPDPTVVHGAWGAFWLMNRYLGYIQTDSVRGQEIDIVETINGHINCRFNWAVHWSHAPWEFTGRSRQFHASDIADVSIYDGGFHTFGVEWSPTEYIFFVNGIEVGRLSDVPATAGLAVNQNPNYMKLSMESARWALPGGNNGLQDMPLPIGQVEHMYVDYVTVWNGPRPLPNTDRAQLYYLAENYGNLTAEDVDDFAAYTRALENLLVIIDSPLVEQWLIDRIIAEFLATLLVAPPASIASYIMMVESFDWGPGVTGLLLALDDTVEPDDVNVSDLTVFFYREPGFRFMYAAPFDNDIQIANITNAFVADANGSQLTEAGSFIMLELEVHPDGGRGINPFTFTLVPMGNNWANPFITNVTWKDESFVPERTAKVQSIVDLFNKDNDFVYQDITLRYGYFTPPEAATSDRPVIIWLHGAGEGTRNLTAGTDAALLGNRVTQLAASEIQEIMGGAHVFVPQAPTMWLAGTSRTSATGYVSNYEDALMALIDHFLINTPGVDMNRIYVGGCSNGGYMAIRAIMRRPDLFAASFPICILYEPNWLSDEKIASVAHIPMWLVHDIADPTTPHAHSQYLLERLQAKGTDVYLSTTDGLFSDEFFDAYGNPWEFNRHWSWIPVLNNALFRTVNGGEISIFEWMALQPPIVCDDCGAYPCECTVLCEYCAIYPCAPFFIRLYLRPNGAEMHRLRFNNPHPNHNNLIPSAHFTVTATLQDSTCAVDLLTIIGGANNTIQRIDIHFGNWSKITVTVSRGCAEDTVVLVNPLNPTENG